MLKYYDSTKNMLHGHNNMEINREGDFFLSTLKNILTSFSIKVVYGLEIQQAVTFFQ